jgi:hypothetical protein
MRVPADLVGLIGKAVEKASLGTKNIAEAKRLHAEKVAALLERWNGYRQGVRAITLRQIAEIAGDFYRSKVKDYQDGRLSSFVNISACAVTNAYVDHPHDQGFRQNFRDLSGCAASCSTPAPWRRSNCASRERSPRPLIKARNSSTPTTAPIRKRRNIRCRLSSKRPFLTSFQWKTGSRNGRKDWRPRPRSAGSG